MSEVIDRNNVIRLLENESAQLIEVLPRDEYESVHIAGAINLPLKQLSAESSTRIDRSRPVIVYCNDFQ